MILDDIFLSFVFFCMPHLFLDVVLLLNVSKDSYTYKVYYNMIVPILKQLKLA